MASALQDLARRAYFSHGCTAFYVVVFVLNLTVLIWVCADHKGHPQSPMFLTLEVVVTLALVLEVVVRLVVLRKQFWHHCCNVFDVVVSVLCTISLVLYLHGASKGDKVEGVLSDVSLLVRNGLQVVRMLLWCRATHLSQLRQKEPELALDVDLHELDDVDLTAFDFDLEETEAMLAAKPGPVDTTGVTAPPAGAALAVR